MVYSLRRLGNPPLISALVALLVFAVTLNGVFVYDDIAILEKDARIADPSLWGQYWTDSYNFGVDNLYRPLVSMSYAIQHYLHGPRPMPFHLVNWILHAVASALVALFAMTLGERCEIDPKRSRAIGYIAGILFATHPIHVEAVANVVGRAELMCAIGVLGAMWLFLGKSNGCPGARIHDPRSTSVRGSTSTLPRGTQSELTRARVIIIYLCFALALLSKEQGMLVPLLLGVLWATRPAELLSAVPALTESGDAIGYEPRIHRTSVQAGPILFLLLALTLAGYVVYRESILKFWWDKNFLDIWIQPLAGPDVTLADRLLVPITIMGRYLQLLVAPVTLRLDYGGLIVPGTFNSRDPYFYLGIGAILLWFGLFTIALKQRDRFSITCLLCFAFIYGLLGNLITLIGVNMAERLMYLPSIFFVMIIARWLARVPKRAAMLIAIAITCLFAARSYTYALRWNDKLGFYIYSAGVEPRSLKATQLAMQEYLDRGDLDRAEEWAHRALRIQPENDDAILRLAMVKIERGAFDDAEQLINRAEQLNPVGKSGAYRQVLAERRATTQPTR